MKNQKFLKIAGVLLLSALLLFSATAVTANTNTNINIKSSAENSKDIVWIQSTESSASSRDTTWVHYDDGTSENGLGLTAGGTIDESIKLTPTELAGLNGYITSIKVMHGCPLYPGCPETPYTAWIFTNANHPTGDPLAEATLVGTGTCPAIDDFYYINLTTPYAVAETDTVWVGVSWTHTAGSYPMGFDTGSCIAGKSDWLWDAIDGWLELGGIGYPGNWNLWVGIGSGGADTTPPVTISTLTGTMNGTVYISDVTVTLTATDDSSGVNYTRYKVDDGAWATYTAPFVVSANGAHTVLFYSVDFAGNQEAEKTSEFTIQKPVAIVITIKGGFGVSAVIKNTGTTDLTNVAWTISLNGGFILLGKTKSGEIPSIAAGAEVTVKDIVFGIGRPIITVSAGTAEVTATGTVLLFFVIGVK
jgi:hypothetical protein